MWCPLFGERTATASGTGTENGIKLSWSKEQQLLTLCMEMLGNGPAKAVGEPQRICLAQHLGYRVSCRQMNKRNYPATCISVSSEKRVYFHFVTKFLVVYVVFLFPADLIYVLLLQPVVDPLLQTAEACLVR